MILSIVLIVAAFVGGALVGANNPIFIKKRVKAEIEELEAKYGNLPAAVKDAIDKILSKVK